jgi:RNA polymerase sigma-70 factor (ECF subfamily)
VTVPAQLFDITDLRRELVRVMSFVCPSWLSANRDDLVQAALMRVLPLVNSADPSREHPPKLTRSYLYRAAHSALVDEIRRVRRRRETDLEDAVAERVVGHTADPERQAAAVEIGRAIQACLVAMKEERRLAVTLHLQGHTVAEAAKLLGWTLKRTENLVYRGLGDLRGCLTSKGIEP